MKEQSKNKRTTDICMIVIDKCGRDFKMKYFKEDILKECNNKLKDNGYKEIGENNLDKIIGRLRSRLPKHIELRNIRDGKYGYYRYTEEYFSLFEKNLLNPDQIESLKQISKLLSNFKDMPQFDWALESVLRIDQIADFKSESESVILFEQNLDYIGLEYISTIYQSIKAKKVLKIGYNEKFMNIKEKTIHPYILKQYNSRWFLFGFDEDRICISNLALDRIKNIKEHTIEYRENTTIDFQNDYFYDVYGVTVNNAPVEDIVIKCYDEILLKYIETKPIHGSQIIDQSIIRLKLIPNYELKSRLLEYADRIKIVEPKHLRDEIRDTAQRIIQRNK